MNLNLSEQQLGTILSGAVLQAITPENRDQLIREALASILSPKDSYNSKSPLQNAFENAAQSVARQVINEKLSADGEFRAKVESIVTDAVKKSLDEDRETLVDQLSSSIKNWITRDKY